MYNPNHNNNLNHNQTANVNVSNSNSGINTNCNSSYDMAKQLQEKFDKEYKEELLSVTEAQRLNKKFKAEAIQVHKDSQLAMEIQSQFTQGAAWFCAHCMVLNLDINSYKCNNCQSSRPKPKIPDILTKNDQIAMEFIRKLNAEFGNGGGDNNKNTKNNNNKSVSIVNLELARKFLTKYDAMKDNNRNEIKICFHWSPLKNHQSIIKNNLLVPDGKKVTHTTDTGYFGKGIYMSPDAKYAQAYAYNTTKKFFVCLSMPGKVFGAQYPRDLGIGLKQGYDSHSAPQRNNMEWVFFDPAQLLPVALVELNSVDQVVNKLKSVYIPWLNQTMKEKDNVKGSVNVNEQGDENIDIKGKKHNDLVKAQEMFEKLKKQYPDLTFEEFAVGR